jgi:hypothetical protein
VKFKFIHVVIINYFLLDKAENIFLLHFLSADIPFKYEATVHDYFIGLIFIAYYFHYRSCFISVLNMVVVDNLKRQLKQLYYFNEEVDCKMTSFNAHLFSLDTFRKLQLKRNDKARTLDPKHDMTIVFHRQLSLCIVR